MDAPALQALIADAYVEGYRRAAQHVPEVVLTRFYRPAEAAAILGLAGAKSLTDIPYAELPRRKVGSARGATRFLGADLVAYGLGLPVPDTAALVEEARARLIHKLSTPSPVRPAQPGRTRVR